MQQPVNIAQTVHPVTKFALRRDTNGANKSVGAKPFHT